MKINVSVKGDGEPILILHGWGASIKSWEIVQNDLAERGFKVIIPDLPGFGLTDSPLSPWKGEDYISWVLNFIKDQGLSQPLIIAGHSFGGGLAMKLAIDHPYLIKKLILIGAARVATKEHKKRYRKIIVSALAKLGKPLSALPFSGILRKAFYKFIVRERDYERAQGVMRETMRNILKEDVTPLLNKISAPTFIIWGDKDESTPIDSAHIIHREIKGSKLHIISDARHALNLDHPHELAELIYKFAKSV